jgi:hypothetical protein
LPLGSFKEAIVKYCEGAADADDFDFQIETGRMSSMQYTLFHPNTGLNEAQKKN